jgi:hypothetical protein
MLDSVAFLGVVVVTTTPLTNLRVVIVKNFLGSAFDFVRILVFLIMMLVFVVPFSLKILFEFLATKLLLSVLTIVMNFRQR